MNTSPKVFRADSAAAMVSFRPAELGNGVAPAAGPQSYQFPTLDLSASAGKVIEAAAPAFALQLPDASPIDLIDREAEKTELELAVQEKRIQEARAAAEAEMNSQIGALRENLTETIDRISGLATEITGKLETEAVELALEIAKKLVAREVTIDREIVLTVTKTALTKLHARTLAQIHLHPEDLAFVQEHRDKLNFPGAVELIEDNSVTPGGCLIHTDSGDIDGRIESQFDEIAHGLLGNG